MKNFVSTHWGTYETSKKNGKNIKINKWSKDPNPSDFGLGFLKSATDDLRINQPHIRKEWLKDRGFPMNQYPQKTYPQHRQRKKLALMKS